MSLPLAVAEDGTFVVPRSEAAGKEDAELLLKRKPGTFRWRPDVRPPGVPFLSAQPPHGPRTSYTN